MKRMELIEWSDLVYSEAYANWLMDNGQNYGLTICNGDLLLEAQERMVGFEDFLKEYKL